jgi:hypothetical protein
MILLPPAPDKCPACAVEHEPGEPHNLQSLFYQCWFHGQHGRWPTWADAMAHCDDETRAEWTRHLLAAGETIGEVQP